MFAVKTLCMEVFVLILTLILKSSRGCMSSNRSPSRPRPPAVTTPAPTEPPDLCKERNIECQNGGKCIKETGECSCVDGFRGTKCQTPPGIPEGLENYRFFFGDPSDPSLAPATADGMIEMCKSQNARPVAFETEEEWKFLFDIFKANLKYSGKNQLAFYLNARLNNGKYKWLTDGSDLSTKHVAWYRGYPNPNNAEEACVYAFIAADIEYDGAWGTKKCDFVTYDFVCELIDPDV